MKIYSGNDRARELGFMSYRAFMIQLASRNRHEWSGKYDKTKPLFAEIDHGRWMTVCECGEPFWVEPKDPEFGYCPLCGNVLTNGAARLIVFPDDANEIQEALLEREVLLGIPEEALNTQSVLTKFVQPRYISRTWRPGETPKFLREEHEKVKKVGQKLEKEAKHG